MKGDHHLCGLRQLLSRTVIGQSANCVCVSTRVGCACLKSSFQGARSGIILVPIAVKESRVGQVVEVIADATEGEHAEQTRETKTVRAHSSFCVS